VNLLVIILDNSVKYGKEFGKIEISAAQDNSFCGSKKSVMTDRGFPEKICPLSSTVFTGQMNREPEPEARQGLVWAFQSPNKLLTPTVVQSELSASGVKEPK